MAKKNYYAVKTGYQPGIYSTWAECEKQVKGYPGAQFQGFQTLEEAQAWIGPVLHAEKKVFAPEARGAFGVSSKASSKASSGVSSGVPSGVSSKALSGVSSGAPGRASSGTAPGVSPKPGKTMVRSTAQSRPRSATNRKIRPQDLNEEQRAAFEIMQGGENIFLTGEAGTGKSFLIRCFLDQMKASDKNVMVCAPTGIAAIQIHGATLHRTFKLKLGPILPQKQIGKIRDVVKAADIIVIDEISMCRFDIFDYVCRYIQKAERASKRHKQLIVVGDFYQLAPVMRQEDRDILEAAWQEETGGIGAGFAFIAPAWKEMQFRPIVLRQVMRQRGDGEFITWLNNIRHGDRSGIDWFNEHTAKDEQPGIFMYGTNRPVDQKNRAEIEALKQETRIYAGQNRGFQKDLPVSEELFLCEGARVMSVMNDVTGNYQNGSLGTVKRMNENSVLVHFDNGKTAEIAPYTWQDIDYRVETDEKSGNVRLVEDVIGEFTQLPLKIAFAVTIHKSQGQTYDSANLDPACFGEGQLYVALSRVTRADQLHLLRPIRMSDLKVSSEVSAFYEQL